MTFLAIDAQKNLFTLQKSQLQFEQTLVMSRANFITKEMGYYESDMSGTTNSDGTEWDAETDTYYQDLVSQEQYLETRQDSLDSQISALDNEISSMKNMVNSNIKTSCSLNLIGG